MYPEFSRAKVTRLKLAGKSGTEKRKSFLGEVKISEVPDEVPPDFPRALSLPELPVVPAESRIH